MKTKQKSGASLPAAWIVNPKDKGRKSIKGDKIYLDNGQEFEIEIFNPLTESVLADIRLNGNSISKTGLVVRPGQRVYLDCFVDDRKKFIFQTYEVDGSQESIEAIADNGLMEVFFYKEQAVTLQDWSNRFHKVIVHEYRPYYYPVYPAIYHRPYYYDGTVICSGYSGSLSTTTSNLTFTNGTYNTINATNSYLVNNSVTTGAINTNTSSFLGSTLSGDASYYSSPVSVPIETGRVEKGEKSDQQFTSVDMEFEKNYIHHLVFQLLPSSRKPKYVKEMQKAKKAESKNKGLEENDEIIELIKKLSDLHSSGILTDEEFSNKKSDLLSKI
jgi:hypothetical protein